MALAGWTWILKKSAERREDGMHALIVDVHCRRGTRRQSHVHTWDVWRVVDRRRQGIRNNARRSRARAIAKNTKSPCESKNAAKQERALWRRAQKYIWTMEGTMEGGRTTCARIRPGLAHRLKSCPRPSSPHIPPSRRRQATCPAPAAPSPWAAASPGRRRSTA